ncbi:MAG: hypothetical protein AB1898_31095 [Acidobacteriota bacterium]
MYMNHNQDPARGVRLPNKRLEPAIKIGGQADGIVGHQGLTGRRRG